MVSNLNGGVTPSDDQDPDSVDNRVVVRVVDDDGEVGVVVSEAVVMVSEDGVVTGLYSVVLGAVPSGDVTVAVVSGDIGVAGVSPDELVFGVLDWFEPQTVVVAGVDDEVDNAGGQRSAVVTHVVSSVDSAYDEVAVGSVKVTVTDDDVTAVTLSGGGTVSEADTTVSAEITVQLDRVLVAGETVQIPLNISGDSVVADDFRLALKTGVGINSGVTLSEQTTLTPSVTLAGVDAQTATLILTAVDDDVVESAETVTITLGDLTDTSLVTNLSGGVTASDDEDSDTVDNHVTVSITDNDTTDVEDTGNDDSDDAEDTDNTDESITPNPALQQTARKEEKEQQEE
ncbi:MAG: hypothetical protein F4119_07160 [Acidimicrobiia bacterium]|nr:hypothetical protein [Acidimicrobiia bacterium]